MTTSDLAAVRAAYVAYVPPERLYEFPITALDRTGVPVWNVIEWPVGGPAGTGGLGYGPSDEAARVSAWGELVEGYAAWEAMRRLPQRRASHAELVAAGEPAIDPVSLCLDVDSGYDPSRTLTWVTARRHPSGEPVLVPIEFVAASSEDLPSGKWLVTPITNGLGAGDTLARALNHGLLELLQRDGNSVHYRALDRGVGLTLDAVNDPATRALLARLDSLGITVTAKLAATDFGLANVYVVGAERDPSQAPRPIMLSGCGEAAHPDREVALSKALHEFASSRVRKRFYHGPLADAESVAPAGYMADFSVDVVADTSREFAEMSSFASLDGAALVEHLSRRVLRVASRVPFSSLPTTSQASTPAALLDDLTARLTGAGHDILYVELTRPGAEVRAVKVIVPGLEVETMSYGRIGRRNVERLMAVDSPLVGRGAPPAGSARRVHLTAADEQRLGGPVWFDVARARDSLGALYALYREPGQHALGLAAR